jgi:hypothetical protein
VIYTRGTHYEVGFDVVINSLFYILFMKWF